jgi:hypothetical protein
MVRSSPSRSYATAIAEAAPKGMQYVATSSTLGGMVQRWSTRVVPIGTRGESTWMALPAAAWRS